MHDGVNVAYRTVELCLIKIIEATGVVQVKQFVALERLGKNAAREMLCRQVGQLLLCVFIVVGKKVELFHLHSGRGLDFQHFIKAVGTEDNLFVVISEDG